MNEPWGRSRHACECGVSSGKETMDDNSNHPCPISRSTYPPIPAG